MFACNTAFRHRSRHITTWVGYNRRPVGHPKPHVFTQIDFILCRVGFKRYLRGARSYGPSVGHVGAASSHLGDATSDHRLVMATFRLPSAFERWWAPQRKASNTYNLDAFLLDASAPSRYNDALREQLAQLPTQEPTTDPAAAHVPAPGSHLRVQGEVGVGVYFKPRGNGL